LDSGPLLCVALNLRGTVLNATGQPMRAISDHQEACEIARAHGRAASLRSLLNGLAETHRGLGNLSAAEGFYLEAIQVGRELQSPGGIAPPMCNLVRVLIATGALERARSALRESATITATAGLTAMVLMILEVAAGLAATEGEHRRAARFYGAS